MHTRQYKTRFCGICTKNNTPPSVGDIIWVSNFFGNQHENCLLTSFNLLTILSLNFIFNFFLSYIDLKNSLAIIKVAKLEISPLHIKGSFTHFSVTLVSKLSCSPTHDRYANSIFGTSRIVVPLTTSSHKFLKLFI